MMKMMCSSCSIHKKIEGSEADVEQQLKNDCDDQNHSLPEEADEVPGTTLNFSQSTSNSPKMMTFLMKKNISVKNSHH